MNEEVNKEENTEVAENNVDEVVKSLVKDDIKEEVKTENTKKNNSGNILVILLFIVLVVASCVGVYFVLNKDEDKSKEQEQQEEKVLFTSETLPRVDASLATQPLVDAFVKDFTGKTTKELNIVYTNTDPGYTKLINKEADLIVVTEPSEEELERAKKGNVELEVTKVVNEAFVFFTNVANKVDSLKFEEIQKIYTGEITNWKQVGGDNAKIVAFQRPVNSGSQTGLLSLVMKGKKVKIPTSTEQIQTMEGIIDYVADYNNGKNAVGYSYYYYAETMYKNDNVKYLGINGVKPTTETIQNGSYPILSAYYIVTRKGETNEYVAKLKEAMLSTRGQKVAKGAGYVPVK